MSYINLPSINYKTANRPIECSFYNSCKLVCDRMSQLKLIHHATGG
jgi:hypothetical protein